MLQQLPEELLDRILYHVAAFPFVHSPQSPWEEPENSWIPHQFRSTLLDICLVSKTLHRLALPHLYKAFSNQAERESRVRNSPTPELPACAISPLHDISVRYLHTLCARPDYGNLLRSLSFSMKNPLMAFVPRITSHEEHADLALFSKTAQDFWFGATWTEMVQQKLAAGLLAKMPDATMCLVLLMCPNIETLEIAGANERGIPKDPLCDSLLTFLLVVSTAQVFSSIAPDEPLQRSLILQRVQTLTLAVRPLRLIWPELVAVFALPALRTLRLRNLCTMNAGRVAPRGIIFGRRHYSEIRSLELHWISIPGSCVAKLLRWCPNLTMLDATWGHLTGVHFRDYDCAFHEVGKAVSEYNPLLVSLKLTDMGLAIGAVASRLRFTLRDLQHLTHVDLAASRPGAIHQTKWTPSMTIYQTPSSLCSLLKVPDCPTTSLPTTAVPLTAIPASTLRVLQTLPPRMVTRTFASAEQGTYGGFCWTRDLPVFAGWLFHQSPRPPQNKARNHSIRMRMIPTCFVTF
jgi:hypothetical protein